MAGPERSEASPRAASPDAEPWSLDIEVILRDLDGLGHVNNPVYPALRRAIDNGVHVVMTVQTLWGYAQMYVYDTGRDLQDLGVVPLDNMLPETALMKLGWVLGHTREHDEVMRLMRDPINHEITDREPHDGYMILQGGLPETQRFITSHWK